MKSEAFVPVSVFCSCPSPTVCWSSVSVLADSVIPFSSEKITTLPGVPVPEISPPPPPLVGA